MHEAYLRLSTGGQTWPSERYFYAAAAEAMRRILIERARVSRQKHGGARAQSLDGVEVGGSGGPESLLSLHEALDDLRAHDPDLCDLVMLRYFGG